MNIQFGEKYYILPNNDNAPLTQKQYETFMTRLGHYGIRIGDDVQIGMTFEENEGSQYRNVWGFIATQNDLVQLAQQFLKMDINLNRFGQRQAMQLAKALINEFSDNLPSQQQLKGFIMDGEEPIVLHTD